MKKILACCLAIAPWLVACGGAEDSAEDNLIVCQDGTDNDGDGDIDCADHDCMAFSVCQTTENTLELCTDGLDNDGNGLTDCQEPGCVGFVVCREDWSETCQDAIDNDGDGKIDCDDDGCADFCRENAPDTCSDTIDNDRDGNADCADPDCVDFCGEKSTADCQDGIDNDGDGKIDCADSECAQYLFCNLTEDSPELCKDGIDNDKDGTIDCEDTDCQHWDFCGPMHGRRLIDSWDEEWDERPRTWVTWADAKAECEGLGGRLPTATEIYRNNATSGTGDIGTLQDTEYLWTNIRDGNGGMVAVTVSGGAVGSRNPAALGPYRCVWPDNNGAGFDNFRCYGPPGSECWTNQFENVDVYDRTPLDYAAAVNECAFYGGSIPSFQEFGEFVNKGLPGRNMWIRTGNPMWQWVGTNYSWAWSNFAYYFNNVYDSYRMAMGAVRWSDQNAGNWSGSLDSSQGMMWPTSSLMHFRCVGLADQAIAALPANDPGCKGGCFTSTDRRSPMMADSEDRAAATYSDAVEGCRAIGGEVGDQADMADLIHAGLPADPNTPGQWLWVNDPVFATYQTWSASWVCYKWTWVCTQTCFACTQYCYASCPQICWSCNFWGCSPYCCGQYWYCCAGYNYCCAGYNRCDDYRLHWTPTYQQGQGHGVITFNTQGDTWQFNDGSTGSYSAATTARGYRCVWRSKSGDLPTCAADEVYTWDVNTLACTAKTPGAPPDPNDPNGGSVTDSYNNVWDATERSAVVYADAVTTCETIGARLPTANEIYAARAGEPNQIGTTANTSNLWTKTGSSLAGNQITVRVSDGGSGRMLSTGADVLPFRCIWPASKGDVLSGGDCYGTPGAECQQSTTTVTDSFDRVKVDMAAAIQECVAVNGRLADTREFAGLTHGSWANPGNLWIQVGDMAMWILNQANPANQAEWRCPPGIGAGHGTCVRLPIRQSGETIGLWDTMPDLWSFIAGQGSVTDYTNLTIQFRCIYSTLLR